MSYDEAVNDLVSKYLQGEFPGWVMTDDDTAQMRRDLPDGTFEFIDLQNCVIFHNIIDLKDYSDKELWFYGSMYYDTEEQYQSLGAAIMAECVFENTPANVFSCCDVAAVYKRYLEVVGRDMN